MCAIDALGMPPMLGVDATISSADPTDGQPITVEFRGGRTTWEPATAAVVVVVPTVDGPAADICCPLLDFFASRTAAQAWVDKNPGQPAVVLTAAQAERTGREIFQPLLTKRQHRRPSIVDDRRRR
ncbi:organomercurial lyase [Fodinicola feengrottensis]|uniref:organomercurial lyase n=1 Tax=Fodinicola feengrottensis TaxID=435914 RepID=UPI0024428E40|nr:organomercurial lyase [Fodinicola feengrottensis]